MKANGLDIWASGHIGSFSNIFFWPGLKSDVAKFCRGCHVCQLAGKPNQPIPPAPLHPILVTGETFRMCNNRWTCNKNVTFVLSKNCELAVKILGKGFSGGLLTPA